MDLNVKPEIISGIIDIIGEDFVDYNTLKGTDNWPLKVYPASTEEVALVVALCNKFKMPIRPLGGGTGLVMTGNSHEVAVTLSLKRLNHIAEVDLVGRYISAGSGAITEDIQNKVLKKGLFIPVVPSSQGSTQIGGNVSTSSGSPFSAKYGKIGDYVENLEVVLSTGEVIWTGKNVTKNSSGLNLTQLIVGSEGILGVITQVVLKVIPKPSEEHYLLATFKDAETAVSTMLRLLESGYTPSGVEIIYDDAFSEIISDGRFAKFSISADAKAGLIVCFDGDDSTSMLRKSEQVGLMLQEFACGEVFLASDKKLRDEIWSIRGAVVDRLNVSGCEYRDVDVCVPRVKLNEFISGVRSICMIYKMYYYAFGHAMDGNLHLMVMYNNTLSLNDLQGIDAIYKLASKLGGVISGEHGIGQLNKKIFTTLVSPSNIRLSQRIKSAFDPNGIMNPGTVF